MRIETSWEENKNILWLCHSFTHPPFRFAQERQRKAYGKSERKIKGKYPTKSKM